MSIHQFLTDEEAVEMLKEMEENEENNDLVDIKDPTPNLRQCTICYTGLMTAKFIMRHLDSGQHKDKTPAAPWRSLLDLGGIYEHGPSLFKCLFCNSGFFNLRQLESHLSTKEHTKKREQIEQESVSDVFEQNMPLDPPRCDNCDRYFAYEVDMRCHMITKLQSLQTDQMHG